MLDQENKPRVCGNCGAPLDPGAAFCTNCGTPVPKESAQPTGVIDPFDGSPAPSANTAPQAKKCAKCGADLAPDAAFCTVCGTSAGEAAPVASDAYCKKCGAKIEGMPEFCKNCGKPTADGVDNNNKRAKKRMVSLITYLIGAGFAALLGFIFLCTSFVKVSVPIASISIEQSGLGLIGMIFGGTSLVTTMGVSIDVLRWAGWLYLVFLLAIVETIICVSINAKNFRKGDRPVGVISGISAMLIAAIGILIVSMMARSGIRTSFMNELEGSAMAALAMSMIDMYFGGVGVFVVTLIGTGLCIFAIAYSYGTYEKQPKQKLTGNRRTFLIIDIVLAVIIIVFAIITALNPFGNKEYTVRPGDSGTAKIKCRDEISFMGESMYFGVVVFKLEGLEEDASYKFTLDCDFGLTSSEMEGCMCLVYYDDVAGADSMHIYEILAGEDYLATNQVSKPDHAELTFTNNEFYDQQDLAIVVGFSATGKVTDSFRYTFVETY